jgi:hypothetical protein
MVRIIFLWALILAWSALPAASADSCALADAGGLTHFTNPSSPPSAESFLSAPEQNPADPSETVQDARQAPNERLDDEMKKLGRLPQALEQQLQANYQASANTATAGNGDEGLAGGQSIDPTLKPFGIFYKNPYRSRIGSYWPYGQCYNYGRLYGAYYCGNFYRFYYGGFYRYMYNPITYYRYWQYLKHGRYSGRRYHQDYALGTERFSRHQYQPNNPHVRGNRSGSQFRARSFGIRPGFRLGHRR